MRVTHLFISIHDVVCGQSPKMRDGDETLIVRSAGGEHLLEIHWTTGDGQIRRHDTSRVLSTRYCRRVAFDTVTARRYEITGDSYDVLLPTLRVTLKGNRTDKTARAIIDTGSQRSYILPSTAMEMEYEQSRREFFRHSLFGGSSTDVVEHEVYTIHLSDINNSYRCEFEALGQPLICGSIPPVCPRSFLEGSEELDVSDLMRDRIEVLIGADIAGRLLTDDQRRISSGLVAIRTKLGWTVMGKIPPTEVRDDTSSLCVTTLLSLDLENLWKLDAIGVSDAEVEKKTQSLQAEMEEHFAHTTTRDIEGRYEVALPWVQDKERIPSNRDLAENQLISLRRKLEEVGDMKEYGQIFEEWMKQGIIEYAREDKLDGVHYLPHRPVYKRNSQTSRIRPVFNASARKRSKLSLNDCLDKGPNLIEIIPRLLNKFRKYEVGVSSDIEKAFLQIGIKEEDRDYIRFLWHTEDGKLITYRHKRVVFGITTSPYLLKATLSIHLDKAPEHLKITAEQLKSSFYVDNCLSSFQNVEETEKFVKESTELLSTACFNLRDWDSYVEKTTLHIFCDASQFAYATCIFLRIEKEDRLDIQLIQARTRVAPLKKLTIPRLELLACLIGARLAANVIQDLEFEEIPRFYWTDSTNALCWIQREDNWAAFVMNRVKEIHNLSSPESWRHIPGRLNPADLPSRGCSAESLKETRWWEGPAWLKESQEEWPKSTIIPDLEIVYSERRKTILNTLCTTRENENLFGRYSHFLRIVRITAWIYRFFNNAKIDRRKIISKDLSTEEITKSEIILMRLIQRESFSGHEDKKLQGFKLLVDSSGILRIKTKICRREDFANFRMPILLPSDHFLVSLLIRWNHETHGHAGLQTLLGILRENYWILRSRKTVKKIINQCIRCKRFTATPATVESTSLPEDRVRDAAVFEIVGVDLTGHLILKNKKKAWIVIFTCAVYRGVHLELVTSLSMEAFLQAFRRFIARRGRPLIVYSDNGTNFKGMANALKKIDFSRLKCDPTLKNITWKFIPPGAPWWGGWWERLIGMMKQLLFRILGQTSLGYEELSTVMCDVESLMNTRPLTYLTEESEDLAPLTPSLFLHEVREVGVPDLDLIDNQTLSRKYQYIKRAREDLRERFRIEYFGFLRQETRRLKTTIPFKVGDMVLIGQESLKRLHWPLARIIQLYPGKDGLVRVAKVKTSSGDKIRPIQKLYNLEITPEIRCRDPLTERSPTQEVRLTTEEDPLTSQQEQHHIDTPNVVSSYGRPIKRPNRLDLLNFSFPCLSRRDANSKDLEEVVLDALIFVRIHESERRVEGDQGFLEPRRHHVVDECDVRQYANLDDLGEGVFWNHLNVNEVRILEVLFQSHPVFLLVISPVTNLPLRPDDCAIHCVAFHHDCTVELTSRLPRPKSRQDSGRQGTSKQIDHCLYRKMEQGREEDPKEPMESDPDSESGENTTFPKKETTLGRTQEVPPSHEDAMPPPPVSDVLGSLARTLYQLSSATGLSRDVELPRYDSSYEAQSFFTNYDAQADRAQLQYSTRLRKPPDLLQAPLRVTNTRAHVTRSPDPLYTTSPAQAVNS
ncbi:hypothetical protein LAZ67_11001490 [Cordylochernes scorpioides]|uniref:Integrase catalytic domain-containing protein n=1 Tax=Cordylochernes scorpioides TaxID=51811 RepID=A0ABY6L091_9ARAC|nr:hypothetical protein LAZ67_11001490 [Cordylochernes scorpioides]